MTDEERAEEFADNLSKLELTCSLLSAKDKSSAYRLGRYEGFLAGFEAGKCLSAIDWHDLRKDPNDLPNENNREYLVYIDWLGRKIELLNVQEIKTYKNIIAWCEIPTYPEVGL